MNELERLTAYRGNEPTPEPKLTLELQGLHDAPRALARLREIMRGVLSIPAPPWHEAAAEDWAAYLPAWFVGSMRRFTEAEIIALPGQWHYESWVATMADRQWAWWGAEAGADGHLRVVLIGFELVYNVEPLLYAMRVSGDLAGEAPVLIQEQLRGTDTAQKKPAQNALRRLWDWLIS